MVGIVLKGALKCVASRRYKTALPWAIVVQELAQIVPPLHVLWVRAEDGADVAFSLNHLAGKKGIDHREPFTVRLREPAVETNCLCRRLPRRHSGRCR